MDDGEASRSLAVLHYSSGDASCLSGPSIRETRQAQDLSAIPLVEGSLQRVTRRVTRRVTGGEEVMQSEKEPVRTVAALGVPADVGACRWCQQAVSEGQQCAIKTYVEINSYLSVIIRSCTACFISCSTSFLDFTLLDCGSLGSACETTMRRVQTSSIP